MTDYTPLQNKYRPRKLSDLIGQDVLVRTVANGIKHGRLANAFLFIGPYGCGKTSAARLLAACINSPGGETTEPKLTPEIEAIFRGESSDVIEIDAASNSGIDHVRDLKTESSYRAAHLKYKVFIIDEVHGLSSAAFEALLKTLEEPPDFCKFILCTTEAHKIKDTIFSRCQDFAFRTLPWSMIAAHVKDVAAREGIEVDNEAAKVIAKRASGHVRDGLKYLDMAITYADGKPVTGELARAALGVPDESLFFELVDAVVAKSMTRGLKAVQGLLCNGQPVGVTLDGLMDHLRTLLVVGACESTEGLLTLSPEEKSKFVVQRGQVKLDLVDDMVCSLVSIHRGLSYSVNPQVLFEQFLLRSIRLHHRLSKAGATE